MLLLLINSGVLGHTSFFFDGYEHSFSEFLSSLKTGNDTELSYFRLVKISNEITI